MSDHRAMRPSWHCVSCGDVWPCHGARLRLRAEFDGAPVSLAIFLAGSFLDACEDLASVPAGRLHDRFLGWMKGA